MNKITKALKLAEEAFEALVHTPIAGHIWTGKCNPALFAIRGALAEPDIEEMTLTQIAARHEQAEQEPVAWTYEEVKSAFEYLKLQVKGPDDKWTVGESCTYFGFFRHGIDAATQRRTSPVRTKDLSDEEIAQAYMECTGGAIITRCRAVIAADREKNRG